MHVPLHVARHKFIILEMRWKIAAGKRKAEDYRLPSRLRIDVRDEDFAYFSVPVVANPRA